ncbi:hypothetical protein ElyMa_006182600 [Elysia marginata]|uniref:Uncharacterized protein n=1 Tax=Elysia marginata TaxID=1093978 RepID=A0AAV4H509_9GAST|nr:hypothetical protein ElyMa_006182600 [Elysia marginata]
MLAGEHLEPMQLQLGPLLQVLDQLSSDQLTDLYNVTGTSSKLGLLYFLSRNNITMDTSLAEPGFTPVCDAFCHETFNLNSSVDPRWGNVGYVLAKLRT